MYTTNAIEAKNANDVNHGFRSLDIGAPRTTPAPAVSTLGAQQNDLLRALSREDLILLFEQLEFVKLSAGQRLYECGGKVEYAYFPTNAIISLQYVMEDGATTEIAVVGREGVAGISLHALDRASCDAVVQAPGYGYRLKTEALRVAFNEGGALAQQLMRYTSAMFAQLAQNVVGSRHSTIEQKLCRWLLDRLDRSMSNELKVTQETIAQMLGVRRESITCAAGKLQDEGMIECWRGLVVVLDRSRMEEYAGTCYRAGRSGVRQLND
ncbi:Crp/Fnr family transcriptional regulator [Rugamonas sp.]|uniref:Crp/Fnr family transcriptional regulator n=1 Tax=Rugamonas sp. TaxID=1926287 RepID=UPI0025FA8229|nr:Crp/Fnr family transcriptional regulator [Rugamonas sp.]